MRRRRFLLLPALAFGSAAHASHFEIIELRNRPAATLAPLLRPHLWPGESLTGEGFRLILSAPPPRAAELRRLAEALDVPPVPIRLTLRLATQDEMALEAAQGGMTVEARPGADRLHARVEVLATRNSALDERTWEASGVAGEPIRIETGIEFPYPAGGLLVPDGGGSVAIGHGLRYRALRSGFHALVRVTGDRFVADIAPRREDLVGGGAELRSQRLRTRIRGRLGAWVDLGGTGGVRRDAGAGTGYRTLDTRAGQRRFWLRVERLE